MLCGSEVRNAVCSAPTGFRVDMSLSVFDWLLLGQLILRSSLDPLGGELNARGVLVDAGHE